MPGLRGEIVAIRFRSGYRQHAAKLSRCSGLQDGITWKSGQARCIPRPSGMATVRGKYFLEIQRPPEECWRTYGHEESRMKDVEDPGMQDNSLSRWIKANYTLLISVFLIGLFSYGFAIFNYNFGIDEDSAFGWGPQNFLLGQAQVNRWAMYAYYYVLLPGVFYPFIGNVLAIFFISLSYCIFISNHSSLFFSQKLLFCGIAISLPTFGAMLEFSFQTAQLSCSVALVIVAYLLVINGHTLLTKWVMPIILCTFATFTYQSLLYVIPGLFFIDCLLGKFDIAKKATYRVFGEVVFICVISLLCYVVGCMLLHLVTRIPQSHYGEHAAIYLHKSLVASILSLSNWLMKTFKSTLLSSFLFLPVPMGMILLCARPRLRYILLLFLIVGYFFFPFFGLGITLPIRAWFFVPFIYAAVFLSAYINVHHKFRILFLIFSIWIICFNSSINARFALLDNFSEKRDQLIASRIYNELSDVASTSLKDATRSLVIGTVKLTRILPEIGDGRREVFGASFFSWDGEHQRIYEYLKIFGVQLPPTINSSPEAQRLGSLAIVEDMPAYPAKGFIRVVDEVLIIKLSDQGK